jgi:hypothetical protein
MLNSLSAVTWEDFIKICVAKRQVSDKVATIWTKVIGVVYAGVGIGMAFLFSNVGGTVLQMSLAFNGATGAPMVGLFILGAFFPWTNWIGAMAGGIIGFAFPMWISIGSYATEPDVMKHMYNSIECCNMTSPTVMTSPSPDFTYMDYSVACASTAAPETGGGGGIIELYTLSYLWYTAVGIMTTVFVGLVVSFLTGYVHARDVDPKFMISYVDNFWCCLPESFKSKCRCGISFDKISQSDEKSQDHSNSESITVDKFKFNMEHDDIIIVNDSSGSKNSKLPDVITNNDDDDEKTRSQQQSVTSIKLSRSSSASRSDHVTTTSQLDSGAAVNDNSVAELTLF